MSPSPSAPAESSVSPSTPWRSVHIAGLQPSPQLMGELCRLGNAFGMIESVIVHTKSPRASFAFVNFIDPSAAANLLDTAKSKGLKLHGRELRVGRAESASIGDALKRKILGGASRILKVGHSDGRALNKGLILDKFGTYGFVVEVKFVDEKRYAIIEFASIQAAIRAKRGCKDKGKEKVKSMKKSGVEATCGSNNTIAWNTAYVSESCPSRSLEAIFLVEGDERRFIDGRATEEKERVVIGSSEKDFEGTKTHPSPDFSRKRARSTSGASASPVGTGLTQDDRLLRTKLRKNQCVRAENSKQTPSSPWLSSSSGTSSAQNPSSSPHVLPLSSNVCIHSKRSLFLHSDSESSWRYLSEGSRQVTPVNSLQSTPFHLTGNTILEHEIPKPKVFGLTEGSERATEKERDRWKFIHESQLTNQNEGNTSSSRFLILVDLPPDITEHDLCVASNRFGRIEVVEVEAMSRRGLIAMIDVEAAARMLRIAAQGKLYIHHHRLTRVYYWQRGNDDTEALWHWLKAGVTRNLYVGNISKSFTEKELKDLFSPYGNFDSIICLPEKKIAFVNMTSIQAAVTARSALNGVEMHRCRLVVNYAKEKLGQYAVGASSNLKTSKAASSKRH